MDNSNNPATDTLRDIHLPDPVGFWPPAPAVWITLILLLVSVAAAWYLWQRKKQGNLGAAALHALQQLEQGCDRDGLARLQELSQLLRRIAISRYPRQDIAGMTGQQWLTFLDQTLDSSEQPFTCGEGRALLEAPYRNQPVDESTLQSLLALSRQWVESVSRKAS